MVPRARWLGWSREAATTALVARQDVTPFGRLPCSPALPRPLLLVACRRSVAWLDTQRKGNGLPAQLAAVNLHAAGIDIGSQEHWVAVPHRTVTRNRCARFGACTADLEALATWLQQCGVTTVAMESTGVYWIPLFELLEARGFAVVLADAREVQRAPGRPKTDVQDCQWLQRLHTYGLLAAAFRPPEQICVLRSYLRQRGHAGHLCQPTYPAYAEGADPDEPQTAARRQRCHQCDGDGDYSRRS